MKRILIFLYLFLMSTWIIAQVEPILLYPDGVPGVKPHEIEEYQPEVQGGVQRYVDVTNPTIYPFIPEGADSKTPAVVICPGGGYHLVSIESEGFNVARWFQERGVAAFVLKYRMPLEAAFEDKSIAPLQDVQQSFKYIIDHAKMYNVDKKNIGVMGFSAGGHLAATASVHYKDPLVNAKVKQLRPAFSILIYPVVTFTDEKCHKGSRMRLIGPEWTKEREDYYSCEKQVDAETPPTFILHAKDDRTVPYQNSVMYKESLDLNAVSNKLVLIEKGGHGFGFRPNKPTNVWLQYLEEWLKEMALVK